jgi:RNA polymerase sigma factor (TIGR02999 family)
MPATYGNPAAREAITVLLTAHHHGDRDAFDRLVEIVYADLHRIARAQLGPRDRLRTLSATAVVHEAYVTLVGETEIPWQNRGHFFAVAARVMRRLVIDYARARHARKRGGDFTAITLEADVAAITRDLDACLALDAALEAMGRFNERLLRTAECRLFAGLSEAETAEALGVSLRTVQREWPRARAWLRTALTSIGGGR